MFCENAKNWYNMTSTAKNMLSDNVMAKYQKLKDTYKDLTKIEGDSESVAQIERDLYRTFPRHPFFSKDLGGKGHAKLKRVLIAFS